MRHLLWAVLVCGLVLSGQRPAEALILGRCGDGKIRPLAEQCEGANLNGATCQSRGFNSGTLGCTATCKYDTSGCNTIQEDLAACLAEPDFAFPASGQTTAFMADKNDGIGGAVAVPDDGTLQFGAPLSYTDNGDGTITDHNTYRWSGNGSQETIWDWIDDLNAANFAGHDDWRIPNLKELQSIVDYERVNPSIDPAFNTNCIAACTVLTCSCTVGSVYWSATTLASVPSFAWLADFGGGDVFAVDKSGNLFVRAVRGGS